MPISFTEVSVLFLMHFVVVLSLGRELLGAMPGKEVAVVTHSKEFVRVNSQGKVNIVHGAL